MGIIYNVSIPLALALSPTESYKSYSYIYECLRRVGIANPAIKPLLSDMGSGLIKFARWWKINQFFCHFHIRRSFGVNELTLLLEVMLNIVSETEFLKEKEKIFESIEELRTNSNDSKCEILIKLINKTKTWGQWHRSVYGMATCSNFAEGFHQILNSITADNHQFFVKLHQVIIKIENKFFNATTYPHYNTNADLTRFRQEADEALATKNLKLVANVNVDRKIIKRYTKSQCRELHCRFISKIHDIPDYPCPHTIKHFDANNKELPKDKITIPYQRID